MNSENDKKEDAVKSIEQQVNQQPSVDPLSYTPPGTESKSVTMKLTDIVVDPNCQVREKLDGDTVTAYAAVLQEGGTLDPIKAYQVSNGRVVRIDGSHRCEATANVFGPDAEIQVVIYNGTLQDAQWAAIQANLKHGLPLNRNDKRIAIKKVLEHPDGKNMSDRAIAKMFGIDGKTVAKIRNELEATAEFPQLPGEDVQKRIGQDGVERPVSKRNSKQSSKQAPASASLSFPTLSGTITEFAPPQEPVATYTDCGVLSDEGQFDGKKLRKAIAQLQEAVDNLSLVSTVVAELLEAGHAFHNLTTAIDVLSKHPKTENALKPLKQLLEKNRDQFNASNQKLMAMKKFVEEFGDCSTKLA